MSELIKKYLTTNSIYSSVGMQFYSKYRFGKLTNYYAREDELKDLHEGLEFLKTFKNKYKNKRCFVIGNGPSLNKQDLTLMKNEFTIGSNYIYHNFEKMGFNPTLFTIVNYLVAEQRIDEINDLDTIKVFPYFLNYCIKKDKNTTFVNSHAIKDFPTDLLKNISWQSTVTFFNLQLAYLLGFKEVYLVGVDNSYVQPKSGNEGSMVEQEEDDPNHFSKTYFKGLQWQKADTDAMDLMYKHIKKAFEKDGRIVYNATHGGKLETFTRRNYEDIFLENDLKLNPEIFQLDYKNRTNNISKLFVSINPDLKDKFGHYLHYDTFLYDNLPENYSIVSLGNKQLDYSLGRENKWISSSFSKQSWDIGRLSKKISRDDLEKFKLELYNGVGQLSVLGVEKVFYMYTGSFNHIKCIYELIKEKELTTHFHINLFWEHFNYSLYKDNLDWIASLSECINHPQIHVYVDSDELNDELLVNMGMSFEEWTMFSITNFNMSIPFNKTYDKHKLNISFPGSLRIEKGYDLTVKTSNKIVNDRELAQHEVFIRSVIMKGTSKELKTLVTKIDDKVNIIKGVLDEEEYLKIFLMSDIVVIPYTVEEFKTRTSGVFSDALIAEKPMIAAKGTWMGNQIEKLSNGLVFQDGNYNSLFQAIKTLIMNYDAYKIKAVEAKKLWIEKNNVRKIIKKLERN